MLKIIGLIIVIIGALLGMYVAGWLCFVGGIVQIVNSCKATPLDALGLALGILRIFATSLAGWATFMFCAWLGGMCMYAGSSTRRW